MRSWLLAVTLLYAVPVSAQTQIPVRRLAPIDSSPVDSAYGVSNLRALSNGRTFYTSILRPVVRGCEPTLATCATVVDSSALTPGPMMFNLTMIPYLGDTTLLVDMGGSALLVVDPNGKVVRPMALPKAQDASLLALPSGGLPRTDPQGRIVYRARYQLPPPPPGPNGRPVSVPAPDTAPIVRGDFDARRIDTLASIRVSSGIRSSMAMDENNRMTMKSVRQPLPIADDWAMLPDGTIAIVRGQDYHVDWIRPDGTKESTSKMSFDWRRLTDDDKQRLRDSVQKMIDRSRFFSDSMAKARNAPPSSLTRVEEVVPINEIPDYYPPIRLGAVFSDAEGRLWILPSTSASASDGLLYDVVNRKGEISERVQLPPNTRVIGFGPNETVYLASVGGARAARIVRARVQR